MRFMSYKKLYGGCGVALMGAVEKSAKPAGRAARWVRLPRARRLMPAGDVVNLSLRPVKSESGLGPARLIDYTAGGKVRAELGCQWAGTVREGGGCLWTSAARSAAW